MKNHIIAALDDVVTLDEALFLAEKLSPWVGGFKISSLIDRYGVRAISAMKEFGFVMSDLKIHDIPSQAARRVKIHADAGARFITVHSSGGEAMILACAIVAPLQTIAVTVLTSLDEIHVEKIFGSDLANRVRYFAHSASKNRAAGIVCAPDDLRYLDKDALSRDFVRITPNVRSSWVHVASDQNADRAMTPEAALRRGAHYVVIGRPITASPNPVEAAQRILHDIEEAGCV